MSFSRPTLSELVEQSQADMESRLPGADSRLRRNVLDVLCRVHASAVDGLFQAITAQARFFPDPANTESIERWASLKGLTRKPATGAVGSVTVTGVNGTVIPAATIFVRADGGRYISTAEGTIAAGAVSIAIQSEDTGAITLMSTGQTLTFAAPISGAAAVSTVNAPGMTGGSNEESDADLSARVFQVMRDPPAGGKAGDYVRWAKEIAGVTRAWVTENWDGLGTVQLLFVMDGREDIIPLSGDVAAVSAKIEAERPVCADVTVAAPVAAPLDFDLSPTPATDDVKTAIEAALRDLIAREAEPGGTLLISHIREAISGAAGETDHVLTSPSANVVAASGEITVLGSITWS